MRPLITVLIVLLLLAIPANAQCPGGKCPVPEVAACDRDCDYCEEVMVLVPEPGTLLLLAGLPIALLLWRRRRPT